MLEPNQLGFTAPSHNILIPPDPKLHGRRCHLRGIGRGKAKAKARAKAEAKAKAKAKAQAKA